MKANIIVLCPNSSFTWRLAQDIEQDLYLCARFEDIFINLH